MTIIVVTGTRKGMNGFQRGTFEQYIKDHPFSYLHHGSCVGVDEQAHHITERVQPGVGIIIHPPTDNKHRAYFDKSPQTFVSQEQPYIQRNHKMIDSMAVTDVLLAFPDSSIEKLRSGTWATIRYAKKIGKNMMIIYPSGLIEHIDRR